METSQNDVWCSENADYVKMARERRKHERKNVMLSVQNRVRKGRSPPHFARPHVKHRRIPRIHHLSSECP